MLIASGIFQVGDDLPSERDLAAALQVSRESVRGGVQILAAKGLLAVLHGARTRVRSDDVGPEFRRSREPRLINSYGLDDVHAARLLNERIVVGDAAERMDEETLRFCASRWRCRRPRWRTGALPGAGPRVPPRDLPPLRQPGPGRVRRRPVRIHDAAAPPGGVGAGRHRAQPCRPRRHPAALEGGDRDGTVRAFDVHIQRIYETTLRVMGQQSASATELRTGPTRAGDFNGRRIARQL